MPSGQNLNYNPAQKSDIKIESENVLEDYSLTNLVMLNKQTK